MVRQIATGQRFRDMERKTVRVARLSRNPNPAAGNEGDHADAAKSAGLSDADPEYRPYCYTCRKPVVACLCVDAIIVPCPYRVIVLQHPREFRRPVGTARILRICLPRAEILVGPDFHRHALYRELVAGKTLAPVVLFPSPDAHSAEDFDPAAHSNGLEPVLVLLDGTWNEAKGLWRNHPEMWDWPRVRIDGAPPSRFRIKRQPRPGYLSTVEATAELLERLEKAPGKYDHMRQVFDSMVNFQIARAKAGHPRMDLRKRARQQRQEAVDEV